MLHDDESAVVPKAALALALRHELRGVDKRCILVAEVVYDNPLDNVEVLCIVLSVVKRADPNDPSAANLCSFQSFCNRIMWLNLMRNFRSSYL